MASLGIDVRDVSSVIRSNHQTVSAGTVRDGSQSFLVRVEGKLTNLDEIRALPLGGGLRLGDVAEVVMAYPEQEEWDFLNGKEALSVRLYKASTANLLAMIDGAKEEIDGHPSASPRPRASRSTSTATTPRTCATVSPSCATPASSAACWR